MIRVPYSLKEVRQAEAMNRLQRRAFLQGEAKRVLQELKTRLRAKMEWIRLERLERLEAAEWAVPRPTEPLAILAGSAVDPEEQMRKELPVVEQQPRRYVG